MNAPLGVKQFSIWQTTNRSVEWLMLEADRCTPAWAFEAAEALVHLQGIGCGLCQDLQLITENTS